MQVMTLTVPSQVHQIWLPPFLLRLNHEEESGDDKAGPANHYRHFIRHQSSMLSSGGKSVQAFFSHLEASRRIP